MPPNVGHFCLLPIWESVDVGSWHYASCGDDRYLVAIAGKTDMTQSSATTRSSLRGTIAPHDDSLNRLQARHSASCREQIVQAKKRR
jgi:hypothetical protein